MKSLILLCPVNVKAPLSVPPAVVIAAGTELVFLFLNFILLSEIANLCVSPIQRELLLMKTSLNLLSTLPRSIALSSLGIISIPAKIVSFVISNALLVPSVVNILEVVKLDVTTSLSFLTYHPLLVL